MSVLSEYEYIVWCIDKKDCPACGDVIPRLKKLNHRLRFSLRIKEINSFSDLVSLLTFGEKPDLLLLHADFLRKPILQQKIKIPLILLHPGDKLTDRELASLLEPLNAARDTFFHVPDLHSGAKEV